MPHAVYVDRGDHWHVIGDYSGSRVVGIMTEAQWKSYYAQDPCFEAMRASQPGAIAGIPLRGVGYWTKDWKTRMKKSQV